MTITEHGYVLQWPDGTIQVQSFATNRHDCWASQISTERGRRNWKKVGLRCVPATRTIEMEEQVDEANKSSSS